MGGALIGLEDALNIVCTRWDSSSQWTGFVGLGLKVLGWSVRLNICGWVVERWIAPAFVAS